MTRTGRPVVDGTALELALLLALTCRCAMNLPMSLRWSDMTKGSMLGANGVGAAVAEGLAGVAESAHRQERHPQPRGKQEHQLLVEPPRLAVACRCGGFLRCLNFVGMDKNGPGGHCSGRLDNVPRENRATYG